MPWSISLSVTVVVYNEARRELQLYASERFHPSTDTINQRIFC